MRPLRANPITPKIEAKRPKPTPAPPRPCTIRTKVSCIYCHDVFTDDVTPGKPYACNDCFRKRGRKVPLGVQLGLSATSDLDQCIRVMKLEAHDVLFLRLPRGATPEVIHDITTKLSASKIRYVVIAASVDVEVLRPSATQETAQ